MAAGKYNILIQQGADYIQPITMRDSLTQVATDLTGCTVRGQVRQRFEDTDALASFVVNYDDLPNGKFTLTISNTVTAALKFDTGVYDVELVYPSGVVDRILQGKVVLSQEVTK